MTLLKHPLVNEIATVCTSTLPCFSLIHSNCIITAQCRARQAEGERSAHLAAIVLAGGRD